MAIIKTIAPIEGSGLAKETSEDIFDRISQFAGYGFNKSHAAAYAAIAYRTAWLKTHHPEAFFAAAMNLDLQEVKEIAVFVRELRERNIPIWQPAINTSRAVFTPVKLKKTWHGRTFGILYALSAIRGVGRSVAEAIQAERGTRGAFRDIPDFLARMGKAVPRNAAEALAKAGAFDALEPDRAIALAAAGGRRESIAQTSLFDMMDDAAPEITAEPLSFDEVLDKEFDVLGHFMSAHPLDPWKSRLFDENLFFSDFVLRTSDGGQRRATMAAVVTDVEMVRTKGGDDMAVVQLSDPMGAYEAVAFSEAWSRVHRQIQKKARLRISVTITHRGDERRLMIEKAQPLESTRTRQKEAA